MIVLQKDPDDRLTTINVKFDWIYDHVRKSIEKGFRIFTISLTMITILQCFIVHGKFDAEYLLHPLRIRWEKIKVSKKKAKFLLHFWNLLTLVSHGIRRRQLDTLPKYASPFWITKWYWLSTIKCYWFSCSCVKIISHLLRCLRILLMNSIGLRACRNRVIRFENWLIFTATLRGGLSTNFRLHFPLTFRSCSFFQSVGYLWKHAACLASALQICLL